MEKLNQARRRFKVTLGQKQNTSDAIPGLLGRGDGTVEVANQAGQVYIRVGNEESYGTAFNNRVPLSDNLPIFVGYDPITDPDRRLFQVLSIRQTAYVDAGNAPIPQVGPHHTTHEFGGGDDVYVEWRRIMGLRVGRPAAFVVEVDTGYICRAGTWILAPVGVDTVDLTAEQAALVGTQAQLILISLDDTGAIEQTNGAIVASPAALTIANCPTPPAGNIPLAAVRIYATQTAIGDTPSAPDIIDLRYPTYNSMNNGGVAGNNTEIQWNNAGVFGASANFTWNNATSRLTVNGSIDWSAGNVIYVPLAGDIQTYVNAAVAGDTLILASGQYTITSSITVDKQLNIVGQGNAGFLTFPVTAGHGTLISSDTDAVVCFSAANDNVRVSDLSINLTGAGCTGIDTAKNLQGIVLSKIDIIVDDNGVQRGVNVYSSDVIIRDVTFYITSHDDAASGIRLYNDSNSTKNATVDCYNVTGTVVGGATSAYGFVCQNLNDANTLTLNVESCVSRVLTGTPLDVAVASISTTTSTSTVNCFLCTLDGADYDAYQTNANVLNLGGSVLVNNTVSGTVTYRAAVAAGLGVFSTSVTAGQVIDSGLTASTAIYANAGKQITSLANAAGYMKNNGAGVLTWDPGTGSGWGLLGNAGTTAFTNFIGTTDAIALVFKTDSVVHGVLGNSTGAVIDGNARGTFSTDWQASRNNATEVASGQYSVISGGASNTASDFCAAIGGGYANTVNQDYSVCAGGYSNIVSGTYSFIGGGASNTASGTSSCVIGGLSNVAAGDYSVACGRSAIIAAAHDGAFLFADGTAADFNSLAANEFAIRARGKFRHAYDDSNYWTADVSSAGAVTFNATGASAGFTFSDVVTLSAGAIVGNGQTIGQAAGPLLNFDDTNNYLEITGCNVGIGNTIPDKPLSFTSNYFGVAADAGSNWGIVCNAYHDGSDWRVSTVGFGADCSRIGLTGDDMYFYRFAGSAAGDVITWVPTLTLDNTGSVVLGSAAIATNATDGFLYIVTCAGTPTGAPTAKTGRVPIIYDTTNNKLYAYNGAWRSATFA